MLDFWIISATGPLAGSVRVSHTPAPAGMPAGTTAAFTVHFAPRRFLPVSTAVTLLTEAGPLTLPVRARPPRARIALSLPLSQNSSTSLGATISSRANANDSESAGASASASESSAAALVRHQVTVSASLSLGSVVVGGALKKSFVVSNNGAIPVKLRMMLAPLEGDSDDSNDEMISFNNNSDFGGNTNMVHGHVNYSYNGDEQPSQRGDQLPVLPLSTLSAPYSTQSLVLRGYSSTTVTVSFSAVSPGAVKAVLRVAARLLCASDVYHEPADTAVGTPAAVAFSSRNPLTSDVSASGYAMHSAGNEITHDGDGTAGNDGANSSASAVVIEPGVAPTDAHCQFLTGVYAPDPPSRFANTLAPATKDAASLTTYGSENDKNRSGGDRERALLAAVAADRDDTAPWPELALSAATLQRTHPTTLASVWRSPRRWDVLVTATATDLPLILVPHPPRNAKASASAGDVSIAISPLSGYTGPLGGTNTATAAVAMAGVAGGDPVLDMQVCGVGKTHRAALGVRSLATATTRVDFTVPAWAAGAVTVTPRTLFVQGVAAASDGDAQQQQQQHQQLLQQVTVTVAATAAFRREARRRNKLALNMNAGGTLRATLGGNGFGATAAVNDTSNKMTLYGDTSARTATYDDDGVDGDSYYSDDHKFGGGGGFGSIQGGLHSTLAPGLYDPLDLLCLSIKVTSPSHSIPLPLTLLARLCSSQLRVSSRALSFGTCFTGQTAALALTVTNPAPYVAHVAVSGLGISTTGGAAVLALDAGAAAVSTNNNSNNSNNNNSSSASAGANTANTAVANKTVARAGANSARAGPSADCFAIPPASSVTVYVLVTPTALAPVEGTVTLTPLRASPVVVKVSGRAAAPPLLLSAAVLRVPPTADGDSCIATFTVTNTSNTHKYVEARAVNAMKRRSYSIV